jgi:hypothetical protein
MASIPKEQIEQLQAFTELLRLNPAILHTPDLKFFKDYIESLGGRIPEHRSSPSHGKPKDQKTETPKPEPDLDGEDLVESDVEYDNEGVIGNHHLLVSHFTVLIVLSKYIDVFFSHCLLCYRCSNEMEKTSTLV